MKKVLVILLVAGVTIGSVFLYQSRGTKVTDKAPQQTAVQVERGPILVSVSTTGRVVANLDVQIKCKASGEVRTLPFDVSDAVKKGELLVEIDPVDEERSVKQAEVSLSASEARLAQTDRALVVAEKTLETQKKRAEAALKSARASARDAQDKAKRTQVLVEKHVISDEVYGTAETVAIQAAADEENAGIRIEELKTEELALEVKRQDVKLAAAQVESDKIALSNAQQRLKDTKVVAPIDGVVSSRDVQIGQIISSGISNVGGGSTVLTLSDLARIFALASVDESDIGKVKVGQEATITVDAFADMPFRGKVVRIATTGVNASNVVTFEVKIEVLDSNKSLLKPEMTANVEIIAARKDDALRVPAEAVYRRHGGTYVSVVNDGGTVEERPVQVGISDSVTVEIVGGLKQGERVAVQKTAAQSRWRDSGGPPVSQVMFGR